MTEETKAVEDMTEEELENQFSNAPEAESETQEESIETETETSADEPAIETGTETSDDSTEEAVDPVMAAFKESGLDKTYASPEAALKELQESQTYVGQLKREISDLRGQAETPKSEPEVKRELDKEAWLDKLNSNPEEAFKEMSEFTKSGEVDDLKSEVQYLRSSNELAQVVAEFPDIQENQQPILDEIKADAKLWTAYATDPAWAVKQGRNAWLAKNPPKPKEPEVVTDKVSQETKEEASTVSKGQTIKRGTTKKSTNWDDMTEEEIESSIGVYEE